MSSVLLREFIESVPTCPDTATLEEAFACFQQEASDILMVIDGVGCPVGVVTYRALVTCLLSADKSIAQLGSSARSRLCISRADLLLLQPVAALPLDWTLNDFSPYLDQVTDRYWSFVEPDGTYWGMLASARLLQHLAIASTLPSSAPAGGWAAPPLTTPSSTEASQDLIQLLERVPIPIMLQTSQGHIISQNQAWRQQIGALIVPQQVSSEAATLLGEPSAGMAGSSAGAPSGRNSKRRRASVGASANEIADETLPKFCRLGADGDSCVCVCPTTEGHDRIWQFVKVPVWDSPSLAMQTVAEGSARVDLAERPFQLAPLHSGESGAVLSSEAIADEGLWLVMAQDLTEHQQVTRELAAKNADLVQLNRLKDEFLACITHELKTPLTAILGLSSLLKDQHLGTLNPRQSRYAQLIHQSGRHLILIVNDILDLTRIETGQLDLQLELLMIESVCNRAYTQAKQSLFSDVGAATQPDASAHSGDRVIFNLEIQPGITTIVADELRLRQMLANLLSNAIKFTEPGGQIGLTVETWEGWIAFTVWDTGIGIPSEKQHLVFQKFQQLEDTLTRQYEGTGLGLFLTQRLARLHGGDVTFVSAEGNGSQFTLLLPPSPPGGEWGGHVPVYDGESQLATQLAQTLSTVNRLVLVVESVPQMLHDLTTQLNRLGYRVAIARSGTEALEKIRCLQPSVVLLNPLLPMLSGWDVLTLLKADAQTKQIPIVVIGSWGEYHQAHSHGASDILNVPIQLDALQRTLVQVTHQRSLTNLPLSIPEPTVLHLHLGAAPGSHSIMPHDLSLEDERDATSEHTVDLNRLLYPNHCRVLEVDDLDQADLMAQVWKPDVILLDGHVPDPFVQLQQLSTYPVLAALPLITLTPDVTQAANLIPELAVYPYLDPVPTREDGSLTGSSTLFQVIQVAAGMGWTPHVLMIDVVTAAQNFVSPAEATQAGYRLKHCLEASAQYLQAAGFRSSINNSWGEAVQSVRHQSIDLMVLFVRQANNWAAIDQLLQTLGQEEATVPLMVWCGQVNFSSDGHGQAVLDRLQAMGDRMLLSNASMPELVAQINELLPRRGHR